MLTKNNLFRLFVLSVMAVILVVLATVAVGAAVWISKLDINYQALAECNLL